MRLLWLRFHVLSGAVGLSNSGGCLIHHPVKALNCGTLPRSFSILLLHKAHHSLVAFHVELRFIFSFDRASLINIFDVMSIIGNVPHSVVQSDKHRLVKQIIPSATHSHTFIVDSFHSRATDYSHFNFLSILDFKFVLVIDNLNSVW